MSQERPDDEHVGATVSGLPLRGVYGPRRARGAPGPVHASEILPGEPPFLRGAFPEGYRSKPWRIFQLSGFGNPEDEGERIRYLLEKGETGFIMEHDRMTADHLYDVDHPEVLARSEDVGLSGAVQLSARDTALVLEGIDQTKYYAHPGGAVVQHGPYALAAYLAVAKRRGVEFSRLVGTGQSDFFLTYLGCITNQQIPARDGLKLNGDLIDFCAEQLPRWVPVSIAGYNGADTGLNAYQELAAVFANAIEHLEETRRRGTLPLEAIAKSLGGVNFRVGMDFMEEVAKLRVARKMWCELLTSRYGITDPRALKLRIHVVTAGSAMTYQEPMNNIVRGTVMALASILGGVQSLGVSGYDEALSVPSEEAHHMSVRIQQILAHETNLTKVVDPLGGSYYLEALCDDLEARAWEFLEEIEAEGGFVNTLDTGWLHAAARENQIALEDQLLTGEREIVGVNVHPSEGDPFGVDGFPGSDDAFERAMQRLADLRRTRDARSALSALADLERVCRAGGNIVYPLFDAVDAEASLGEIGNVFREVYGDWKVPISF